MKCCPFKWLWLVSSQYKSTQHNAEECGEGGKKGVDERCPVLVLLLALLPFSVHSILVK